MPADFSFDCIAANRLLEKKLSFLGPPKAGYRPI